MVRARAWQGHKEASCRLAKPRARRCPVFKEARALWLKVRLNPAGQSALALAHPTTRAHRQDSFDLILERHALRVLGRRVSPHVGGTASPRICGNGANVVYVQRLLGHKSSRPPTFTPRRHARSQAHGQTRHPRPGRRQRRPPPSRPKTPPHGGGLRFNHLIQPKP